MRELHEVVSGFSSESRGRPTRWQWRACNSLYAVSVFRDGGMVDELSPACASVFYLPLATFAVTVLP